MQLSRRTRRVWRRRKWKGRAVLLCYRGLSRLATEAWTPHFMTSSSRPLEAAHHWLTDRTRDRRYCYCGYLEERRIREGIARIFCKNVYRQCTYVQDLSPSIASTSLTAALVNTSTSSLPIRTESSILIPIPRKCVGHRSSFGTYTPGSIVMQ